MKALTANKKSYVYIPLIILIAVIWFIILMKAFSRLELNSDMAGMVIEANEIISGNVFLNGRTLTGLTFFPTDLLFFCIAALFFGMSGKTYILALILMYIAVCAAAFLIIWDIKKSNKKFIVLALLLFAGFPRVFLCRYCSVHMGCFAWSMFAAYFLNKVMLTDDVKIKRRSYIAAAIFMTMASMADSLAYITIIIPVMLFSIIRIFRWLYNGRQEKLDKFSWISFAVAAGAAVLGKILEKIYIAIGDADLRAYIGTHRFIDLNQLSEKWILFIKGIAAMFGADFFNGKISSFSTLVSFAKFFVVIAIVVIGIIFSVKRIVLYKNNYASVVLGLGFSFISILMLFTDFSVDIETSRYFSYLPFIMAIWLVTWLNECKFSANKMGKTLLIVVCTVFIVQDAGLLIFDTYNNRLTFEPISSGKEEMVEKIVELGLKNGYSEYWDANYSTVQSKGSVKVNAVNSDGTFANVFYWFNNPDDYKEYANFVITGETLQQETVQNIFGTPQSVEAVAGNKKIMVYDYDLSKAIRFVDEDGNWSSEIEKENIYACLSFTDACHNESSYNENGTRYLSQGGFSFGPYISLQAGTYEVEIIGDGLDKAAYRAYTLDADNYILDVVEISQKKCIFTVHVDKPTDKFEFCIENGSDELIELRQMFIR